MSEIIKSVFEGLKAARDAATAVAPGLKDIVPEVTSELSRLGTQGSMEMACLIFNGQAFTPYGPGAYPPAQEEHREQQQEQHQEQQQGIER